MTTLISVHTSEGAEGRCDARCYDAKNEHCECVCGGRNHGVGENKAKENTREYAEIMLAEYAEKNHLQNWSGDVTEEVFQLDLFSTASRIA